MATGDNTLLNPGLGGDVIRTINDACVKTQVVKIEQLVTPDSNNSSTTNLALGILPAELRARADAAVMEADAAQAALAAGQVTPESAIGVAMQARAEYDEVFVQAYKEAYIAEIVAGHWNADMEANLQRRRAIALLLH